MGIDTLKRYAVEGYKGKVTSDMVTIEWLANAGFRFEHKGKILMIDPFVTRPGMLRTLLMKLPINKALCAELFPRADYLIAGHSHYDHLQDIPEIAVKTGAEVYGSQSTANVCLGYGIAKEKLRVVEFWKKTQIGPFTATFIPSPHGKALMGRVPVPGTIDGIPSYPMKMTDYKLGQVFSIILEIGKLRILETNSADLIDAEIEKVGKVDILLLCLAGRAKTPDYVKRLVTPLKPSIVIPHHYDNFFSGFNKPMRPVPGIDLPNFVDEAEKIIIPSGAKVLCPEKLEKIAFDINTAGLVV